MAHEQITVHLTDRRIRCDKAIADGVRALNERGFATEWSCEGSTRGTDLKIAYVSFADEIQAPAELAAILRACDMECGRQPNGCVAMYSQPRFVNSDAHERWYRETPKAEVIRRNRVFRQILSDYACNTLDHSAARYLARLAGDSRARD